MVISSKAYYELIDNKYISQSECRIYSRILADFHFIIRKGTTSETNTLRKGALLLFSEYFEVLIASVEIFGEICTQCMKWYEIIAVSTKNVWDCTKILPKI